jgi:hypothetical protein
MEHITKLLTLIKAMRQGNANEGRDNHDLDAVIGAMGPAIAKERTALEGVRDGMVNAADIHARVGKEPLFRTPKERHADLGAAGALYSHAAKLTDYLKGGGE